MVDRLFSERKLAELYDVLYPWNCSPDDAFYLDLVMEASSVLDVGCGTGLLLRRARKVGHTGRLRGLDPAAAMLDVGRAAGDTTGAGVEWVLGDLTTVPHDREFDLVVMTGHAFQVFLTDDEVRAALTAVRAALVDGGRFAFETRNPAARAWERWTPDHPREVVDPSGFRARCEHRVEGPVEGELVSFTTTFTADSLDGPETSRSTLRFLDADALTRFLEEAGLTVEARYGWWDRSPLTAESPEIIVIARRA
ncbi:class I SAM-dependent methyltransferase [Streptomyces sp. ST2-7A]|uniref:class I SAM-dependent methyltransferase n=1 Tax=Streptomyces sp. ST2-7A TaxID=2907214 RepID=UPI001F2BC91B|nr:class I SAM-dependent methyltransferase [Streptomyces sp. ST2-7A]MCE7080650.1 class I SAM-dependent methyltransferase [Streptomyces sp. ST2-7A]